ncbi:MAG: InlB B-repeat-containing protein [Coriobacteriia bacterium]|nr:InlB B-repeat-containing protein [Coriobacteriia bacterium]
MDQKKKKVPVARKQRIATISRALRMALAVLLALSLMPATALFAYADEAELPGIELVEEEQDLQAQDDLDELFESDEVEGENATDASELELPSNDESEDPSESDFNDEELEELRKLRDAAALELKEATGLELQSTEDFGIAELSFEVLLQANAAMFEIKAQASGQLTIANQWDSAIVVSRNNGTGTQVAPWGKTSLTVTNGDTIRVIESKPGVTFRSWTSISSPFTSGVKAALTAMPTMSAFTTTSAGTIAGDYFFNNFNYEGSLASLPAGSFKTSKITTLGMFSFNSFNEKGALTSLPAGSFDLSGLTTVSDWVFSWFNSEGSLKTLPAGSFDTSRITTVGDGFCIWFNYDASISSLPAGSFNLSRVTTAGKSFFSGFNSGGRIASLPAGSFDLSRVTKAGDDFLSFFCSFSPIASLPASFKLPQKPNPLGKDYCFLMFAQSSLTRGNQSVSLYFVAASSITFSGTNITPVSPTKGATVKVNGAAAPKSYTVSYNANGGSGSVSSQTVTNGASFTTRANGFTRSGYAFTGWNTAANGSGSTWAASTTRTYQATSNTTLYAQWKKSTTATKPKINTTVASVHAGITGVSYKKTLAATGTGTITWSRVSGNLPPGLKLSSAGVISGKPTKPGTYSFKVRATNSLGNTTKSFTIKVNKPSISISYQTHVQSVGWQAFKKDGAMSGTSGKALRLEGIKINLKNNTGISGGIRYSTHVQSIGWQKKVSLNTNGKSLKDVKGPMSGTSGRALRLEAITIELTGDLKKHYDIYYRVHAQSVGWMGWARNGEQAGTAGHAYRLEGIQIVLVPKVGGKKPANTFKGITTPPKTKSFIKK